MKGWPKFDGIQEIGLNFDGIQGINSLSATLRPSPKVNGHYRYASIRRASILKPAWCLEKQGILEVFFRG